jgi:hypothetical protein
VISSCVIRSLAIRQLAALIVLVFSCMILPVGCGNSETAQNSNIPKDFGEKLEKENPELFVKKTGKKKTEILGGRDKRNVIRGAMEKEREK